MRACFGKLSVVPWILFAQMSWEMVSVPVLTEARPSSRAAVEIRDRGGVFLPDAGRRAREALRRAHRRRRAPVFIETLDSIDGARIDDVAGRGARSAGADQLYILVAGRERDVALIAARQGPASRLTDQQRETIRRAFLEPLQVGEADEALDRGVRAIGATLDATASVRGPGGRGVLISSVVLLAVLTILAVSRARTKFMGRVRRHRRAAARSESEGQLPAGSLAAWQHSRMRLARTHCKG